MISDRIKNSTEEYNVILPFKIKVRTVYLDAEREVEKDWIPLSFINECEVKVFKENVLLIKETQSVLLSKKEFEAVRNEYQKLTRRLTSEENEKGE